MELLERESRVSKAGESGVSGARERERGARMRGESRVGRV